MKISNILSTTSTRDACGVRRDPTQVENRGLAWVAGAFVICPCHLPLTLWIVTSVFSGTAAGALLINHLFATGALISLVWLAATARGFWYLKAARRMS